jgi:hypothetical protein
MPPWAAGLFVCVVAPVLTYVLFNGMKGEDFKFQLSTWTATLF